MTFSYMKKILILGANNSQVQLIRAAKEEGYYVIVCDYASDNPGIPLVDKHYQVSYLDQESVLSIARKEKTDGVIGNTDPAMPVVAYIAEQMGLVGNSPKSIGKFISKTAFRQFQEQAGLFCPKHIELDDCADAEANLEGFVYPIIVKPSESSGSQGITKVFNNQTERFRDVFQMCKKLSRDGKVTIEEFVEMPSLEMIEGDVFVMGDEILWNGLFNIRRSVIAPMIPMTKIFPAILSQEKLSTIKTNISMIFKKAGIRHGEYNIELFFTTEGKLFIIEINPRQGGNRIPQLIKQHTGIDFNRLLVTTAVGDNDYYATISNIKPCINYLSQHIVFSNFSGHLETVVLDPLIKKYVIEFELTKKKESKINQRNNATDCIAYVTMQFPDRETQLTYSRGQIEELIYPVVKDKEMPIADCTLPYQVIYDFMTGDAYDFFVPKLEKVHRTASDYAEQFSAYCTIAYDIDEKNRLKGMVAGYTHNLRIPQCALIAEVYVNREHRGKGLGEQLLTRYIDYCKSVGLKGAWLHVREDNYPAQRLYQKLGFVFDKSYNEDGLLKMDYIFDER